MRLTHSKRCIHLHRSFALGVTAALAIAANADIINMEVTSVSGAPNFDPTTDAEFSPNFHQGLAGLGLTHVITSLDIHGRRWIEMEIKVTRSAGSFGEEMVSNDIDITNLTDQLWTGMHFEIGMGLGDNFHEFDGLAFKGLDSVFPPNELLGRFPNIEQNRPNMPTELWFTGPPGMAPGDVADFWLAWKIPDDKFIDNMATITFRQHIPTPGVLALLTLAGVTGSRRRRR